MKRFFGPITALLLVTAPLASATTITINFEEFAYGTAVKDYFNGGRDSLNRMGGHDYGVSFFGDSVRYTPSGAYLAGRVGITLNADTIRSILGTDEYYVSFNAGRYDIDGGFAGITYGDGSQDAFWIGGNGNPYCGVRWDCDEGYLGTMGGYMTYKGPTSAQVTSISFNANRVDNIQIHSLTGLQMPVRPPNIIGSYELTRDIPEPASVALFGIGAAALVARRRRKTRIA